MLLIDNVSTFNIKMSWAEVSEITICSKDLIQWQFQEFFVVTVFTKKSRP